jgi:hypothetical protein
MPNNPRLKGNAKRRSGPYPLAEFPPSLAVEIGKRIVHRLAVGHADITGDDFGGIFAGAIGGNHRGRPLGIADVTWNGCAWSVKTIQDKNPFTQTRVRVISGRNSPVYSSGINDPFADIQATGAAVLNVWNARLNESLNEHDDLRIFVLVRNMATLEFTIIEYEAVRYVSSEYYWEKNAQGNFEGFSRETRTHRFTWQPHGSQFTVIHHVPGSAYRFKITKHPGMIEQRDILNLIHFEDNWIQPVPPPAPHA